MSWLVINFSLFWKIQFSPGKKQTHFPVFSFLLFHRNKKKRSLKKKKSSEKHFFAHFFLSPDKKKKKKKKKTAGGKISLQHLHVFIPQQPSAAAGNKVDKNVETESHPAKLQN